MERKIYGQWTNTPAVSGRDYDESTETETDTYLPVHKQIEAMIIAGERLHANKRLYYESILDGYEDDLDGDIPPTYGLDAADLQSRAQSASAQDTGSDDRESSPKPEKKPKKSKAVDPQPQAQDDVEPDASDEAPSTE